jgi:hypothetical protein
MTGFEPAASSSRTKRATGLRYIPKCDKIRDLCRNLLKNFQWFVNGIGFDWVWV